MKNKTKKRINVTLSINTKRMIIDKGKIVKRKLRDSYQRKRSLKRQKKKRLRKGGERREIRK